VTVNKNCPWIDLIKPAVYSIYSRLAAINIRDYPGYPGGDLDTDIEAFRDWTLMKPDGSEWMNLIQVFSWLVGKRATFAV
jgi:hypothetical protein